MMSLPQSTGASGAPTTGRRGTQRNGRLPRIKETDLTPRERLIVQYMVHGLDHVTLCRKVERPTAVIGPDGEPTIEQRPVPVGEPLTLQEAASVTLIRPRHARYLSTQPGFQRALAKETAAFREGAKARHWRNIDRIGMDPGAGKAADRKVQLQASALLTGEAGERSGTSVNVNVGIQHVTPGYVIDLREPDQPDTAPTIEGNANDAER